MATQSLKALAVLNFAPHDRVLNEAVDVSERGLARCSLARRRPCMWARSCAQLAVELLLEELVVDSWACEIDVRRRSYELWPGNRELQHDPVRLRGDCITLETPLKATDLASSLGASKIPITEGTVQVGCIVEPGGAASCWPTWLWAWAIGAWRRARPRPIPEPRLTGA